MAENVTLEKVLLGDTTKEYVDKVNKAIDNVNSNSDAIEDLTEAVANAGKVDNVKVNDISVVGNKVANVKINGSTTVNVETSSTGEITISAPTLAKSLTLSVNPSTYVLTATLKDANGTVLSTPTVDLPLETMVVGASYDESKKEIVLTLQNKETTRFSVADLVSGLVGTDNNFVGDEVLVADGNGKKAKSSGYTINPKNFDDTDYSSDNEGTTIPTTKIARRFAVSSRPYPITGVCFKSGAELYQAGHEDYDKLIISATQTTSYIAGDTGFAKVAAMCCDKGYTPLYVTYNDKLVLADIECKQESVTNESTGKQENKWTIKIGIDHSLHSKFRKDWDSIIWFVKNQSFLGVFA